MGRLIDADELRDFLKSHICAFDDENEQLLVVNSKEGKWVDLLDAIPTAYDVDKVVEELKSEQIAYFMAENINCTHALRDAIEIIRKGGVE